MLKWAIGPSVICKYDCRPILPFDNIMSLGSNPTTKLLTISEVAELLNISESGVRRLIDKRMIPFIKVMRSIRFDRKDVFSYLENNRIEPLAK